MRALDDMVRQGKVLYIGISDAPAWIVSQANRYINQNCKKLTSCDRVTPIGGSRGRGRSLL